MKALQTAQCAAARASSTCNGRRCATCVDKGPLTVCKTDSSTRQHRRRPKCGFAVTAVGRSDPRQSTAVVFSRGPGPAVLGGFLEVSHINRHYPQVIHRLSTTLSTDYPQIIHRGDKRCRLARGTAPRSARSRACPFTSALALEWPWQRLPHRLARAGPAAAAGQSARCSQQRTARCKRRSVPTLRRSAARARCRP